MIILSKCLAGCKCRYDGKDNLVAWCAKLKDTYEVVEVCPEVLGGLPTPRTPSERRGDRVVNREGRDVTAAFRLGAERAYEMVKDGKPVIAVLKAKSPSCGRGKIYDGTFTGNLIDGNGVFAQLLLDKDIAVYTEREEGQAMRKIEELNKSF